MAASDEVTVVEERKPTRGVAVQLDRERHLRFPLATVQDLADGSFAFDRILWLGLRWEDPDLTQEQVAQLVDLEMIPALRGPLKQATGGLIDLDAFFKMAEAVAQTPPVPAASAEVAPGS